MNRVIFDTGPLVAWFCPRDEHHAWARRTFAEVAPASVVCEAVLAEVCYLVAKEGVPRARVIEFIHRTRTKATSLSNELDAVRALLDRYADIPMDFADACVIRLSELHSEFVVCTTDTDFRFYRKNESDLIPLLAPFAS